MGGLNRLAPEVADDVVVARAFLSRVVEPANIPTWAFVRRVGPLAAARAIATRRDAPDDVLSATAARFATADALADLEVAARHGVRLVVPESDDWPHFAFSALEAAGHDRWRLYKAGEHKHAEHGEPVPPLALWVRGAGDLAALGTRSVGIVGSRAMTAYGENVAAELAYGLARRGFDVVSGGAYGIDSVAHRAALTAGGTTVVVSAGGLDRPYPAASAGLFERAAATGLVISESPPGAAPQRRRFLTRNRLIAALSTGTVIVEAARRSGAINTAGHCHRLGRPLLAVPGPVTSAMSAGCHELLARDHDRAVLVTGVDDVLTSIGAASDLPPAESASSDALVDPVRARLDTVDELARRVFDGFPGRRAVTIDELSAASGVAPLDVLRSLPGLQVAGLAEEADPGCYRVARIRRPG